MIVLVSKDLKKTYKQYLQYQQLIRSFLCNGTKDVR